MNISSKTERGSFRGFENSRNVEVPHHEHDHEPRTRLFPRPRPTSPLTLSTITSSLWSESRRLLLTFHSYESSYSSSFVWVHFDISRIRNVESVLDSAEL